MVHHLHITSYHFFASSCVRCTRTELTGLLDGASNGDGRHEQMESNPQPMALMDGRNHYATPYDENGLG